MKIKYILWLLIISLMACSKKENREQNSNAHILSKSLLNERIVNLINTKGEFSWADADAWTTWNAVAVTDSIISVGYCPINLKGRSFNFSDINLAAPEWRMARTRVIDLVFQSEMQLNFSIQRSQLLACSNEFLPVLNFKVSNPATIEKLKSSSFVRYAEPTGFDIDFSTQNSKIAVESGCDENSANFQLQPYTHYTSVMPNAKASWNYSAHGITDAWNRTSGAGIKIFLIDTGCNTSQDNLGAAFNQGYSFSRTIEKIVTLPRNTLFGLPIGPLETVNDACGHGTMMAGVLAAPRGMDGNAVGVAYNCNLITCRATTDVHIDESREVKGVSDAFITAANRNDVKIISMSLGRVLKSSQIEDAVLYAYQKGKLIFCAAGTSLSWTAGWAGVIFPASMNEVQAVTGVKQNSNFSACNTCHKGAEVDFVVVMERAGDNFHPLTLASSGNFPSTVGGSSVSTASMAGMACLVWSRFPGLSRDQILVRLQRYSNNYPVKSLQWGWGALQVNQATL